MNRQTLEQLRSKAGSFYRQALLCVERVPVKARVVLGFFLVAAVLMAVHTALTAKDAGLHLKVQHAFHQAQVTVWVDDDLAFSGKITGSMKKKFGLIPTDAVQGSSSQIIPVRSGEHRIRVRIEPEDATAQEDSISGEFASHAERSLLAAARRSSLSLTWQGTNAAPVETAASFTWFSRYAGSLFLTIAGSIMSAVAGYVLKELPGRLGSASNSAPKS
jgi:translation initiation factor IF-1